MICFRTAVRLRSACLGLLFKKIMRLNSLGDNSVGGVSTFLKKISKNYEFIIVFVIYKLVF